MQRGLQIAAESLFAILFPTECRLCRSPLIRISNLPVCEPCVQAIAPFSGILCGVCGEKLFSRFVETEDGPLCGMCRRAAPPYRRAVAYGSYEGALRSVIHLLKYQRVRTAAPLLGRLLHAAIARMPLPERILVVPVPLHQGKLRERGFNQAAEIAGSFVRRKSSSGTQLDTSSLIRIRQTVSQTGLTRHQRRANVRGAFAVVKPQRIAGCDVLVIDDVMTTGTTAGECARVLVQAGARQVFVATVARATRETEVYLQQPEEHEEWADLAHA